MSLTLHFHPFASFCWKALIALYENAIPFERVVVDFGDERSREAFRAVWPPMKMPVLRDETRNHTIAESTIVVEYLDLHYPGRTQLIPQDADDAWQARMWDRVYDHYVHEPMQKIVVDGLRPAGAGDSHGVEQARAQLVGSYELLERQMEGKTWAIGSDFTLADCAAAPALFYGDTVVPFGAAHGNLRAYLDRLMARPSFARVLDEARPYAGLFPLEQKPKFPEPIQGG
jgi:glutathione S-transferase